MCLITRKRMWKKSCVRIYQYVMGLVSICVCHISVDQSLRVTNRPNHFKSHMTATSHTVLMSVCSHRRLEGKEVAVVMTMLLMHNKFIWNLDCLFRLKMFILVCMSESACVREYVIISVSQRGNVLLIEQAQPHLTSINLLQSNR